MLGPQALGFHEAKRKLKQENKLDDKELVSYFNSNCIHSYFYSKSSCATRTSMPCSLTPMTPWVTSTASARWSRTLGLGSLMKILRRTCLVLLSLCESFTCVDNVAIQVVVVDAFEQLQVRINPRSTELSSRRNTNTLKSVDFGFIGICFWLSKETTNFTEI